MAAAAATEDKLLRALADACDSGNTAEVSRLLSAGAPVNGKLPGTDGSTPLLRASEHGHADIVRMLLDRGANVDAINCGGSTALTMASWWGHLDIVRLLLDRGANVDAAGRADSTALSWASWRGHVDIVLLLLDRGATVNRGGFNWLGILQYWPERKCLALLRDSERLQRWHRRHSLVTWGHAADKQRG